jgi:hypothetical protein
MHLPYIPNPPAFTDEADKAVVERIKARRGEKGLIALDRTLLHSPPVADGWYSTPLPAHYPTQTRTLTSKTQELVHRRDPHKNQPSHLDP